MRALRDPLKRARARAAPQGTRALLVAVTLAFVAATSAAAADAAVAGLPTPAVESASYFPLAVGNHWTFRCSVEGAAAAGKVRRIVGVTRVNGRAYFRSALTVGNDPVPVPSYLWLEEDGSVWEGPTAGPEGAGPVTPAPTPRPAAGQRLGAWTIAGTERLRVPAFRSTEAVRIENFDSDSPDVSAERRNEWLARYYALGVGPVAEADGLGGRCELSRFKVASPRGAGATTR